MIKLFETTPKDRWIVVTSAFHISRSIGIFRKLGWKGEIIPAPTSFRTAGFSPALWISLHFEIGTVMHRIDVAVREYLALFFYYFRGYTDELWPTLKKSNRPRTWEDLENSKKFV
eukprot:TRINITY_DN4085_c0_g1_i4.p1 TRINITY_DN4085_c0_g1~~TRINITY_DN4085_c0_g1_i4.p1  ORF type:complete len:115 (+),score=9.63 TRINITY_DN4085_c0_g1_i4:187-531(+)